MNKDVFKYLRINISTEPKYVDRLIVSSFLITNSLVVEHNKLIIDHFITNEDVEEYSNLLEFIDLIGGRPLTFEQLIELFEFVISPEDKVISGAVYTPDYIRQYIVDNTLNTFDNTLPKVCDPACGCSGFLYTAALKIKKHTGLTYYRIFKDCLFGLDIENYSVNRSKLLLTLLALASGEDRKIFHFNIFEGNSLSFEWQKALKNFDGFSHVLGNPPYVCSRNIDEQSKALLSNWSVCSSGHPDLYIPFFEIGMAILKNGGVLGYITMNSFFKSLNGRSLREYFGMQRYKFKILDFGSNQIFNSKATYTCICFIEKNKDLSILYRKLQGNEIGLTQNFSFAKVPYEALDAQNGWNLNEYKILNRIEKVGTPLGRLFKSRNGIATLKNELYIFSPVKEDDKYYYLSNGDVYPIEKDICKDIINPNRLIDTSSIDSIKMKVIYPYINEGNKVQLINEKRFRSTYPKAYKYLHDKKDILAKRDKGKGKYENWYAYGRNQSLERLKYKLFFPHITPKTPNFVIDCDENLLFHNGLAIIGDNEFELQYIRKIMCSRLFWFYITNSSRHYGSDYLSLSKNYFKNFGVLEFSDAQKQYIVEESDWDKLNSFLEKEYQISIPKEH